MCLFAGAILTVVQLMKALDSTRYATEINNNLEKLQNIDPKRERYYNDFGKTSFLFFFCFNYYKKNLTKISDEFLEIL